MFKHWFTVAGESQLGNLWDPSSRMGIKENHVEIDKYTDLFMEVEGLIKEERPKNVERKKTAPPKGGRNIQRNYLRALTQKKFEKDPSGCIRGILNNTLVTEGGVENEENTGKKFLIKLQCVKSLKARPNIPLYMVSQNQ